MYELGSYSCRYDLEQHADLERLQVYFSSMGVIMAFHIPAVKIAHVPHGDTPGFCVQNKPPLPESSYYHHCFIGMYPVPWQG